MPHDIDRYAMLMPLSPEELRAENVPAPMQERLLRLRGLYAYWLQFPTKTARDLVDFDVAQHHVRKTQAYDDVKLCETLLGNLQAMSKDFARWRFNQMNEQHIAAARRAGDWRAVASLEKNFIKANQLDKEDTPDMAFDQIVPLNIVPTDDPTVLGLKKVPNLRGRIQKLIRKYTQDEFTQFDEAEEITIDETES